MAVKKSSGYPYSLSQNPFNTGSPVRGDGFIGREAVLEKVSGFLQKKQDYNMLIYGQRRIGKTSLLRKIQEDPQMNQWVRPVYFNLQGNAGTPVQKLLREIARRINTDLDLDVEIKEACFTSGPEVAEDFFGGTFIPSLLDRNPGKSLLLLLDEFDVLADDAGNDGDVERGAAAYERFIPFMARLLEDARQKEMPLKLMFAVGRDYRDLEGRRFGQIAKFGSQVELGCFSREETVSLIRKATAGGLPFSEEAIIQLFARTSGHPYFTQCLASSAFDTAVREIQLEVKAGLLKKQFWPAVKSYASGVYWVWDSLPDEDRFVLYLLAHLENEGIPGSVQTLKEKALDLDIEVLVNKLPKRLSRLLSNQYIHEVPVNSGKYTVFVKFLRSWVTKEISETEILNLKNKLEQNIHQEPETQSSHLVLGQKALYRKGILLLTGVTGYAAQSIALGNKTISEFNCKFVTVLSQFAQKHDGFCIKAIDGCAIFFFPDEERFPEVVSELHALSFSGELDYKELIARLHMVAHYGKFSFDDIEEKSPQIIGPNGIKIIHMEKYSTAFDVIITGFLYSMLHHRLQAENISVDLVGTEALGGFSETASLYKLVFPENWSEDTRDLLEMEMELLEAETREIPVFGNIYPAMSMENHFINLGLHTTGVELELEFFSRPDELLEINEHGRRTKARFHTTDFINAKKFYDNYPQGIILGLPGSGKTTLLKYFAFRELKARRNKAKQNQRLVLFVHCRHGVDFKTWSQIRNGVEKEGAEEINQERALAYLVFHFLWMHSGGEGESVRKQIKRAELLVQNAFRQNRITILVDALDEAPSRGVKDSMVKAIKLLLAGSHSRGAKQPLTHECNRVYLTARYAEQERYFEGQKGQLLHPRFEVKPLDMEQLRDMARFFMGEGSEAFKSFDQTVWQEDVVQKIGGSPLTALLVIAYYDTFRQLDSRFNMYQVLVAFILVRVWGQIKGGEFEGNMNDFFRDAQSKMVWQESTQAREICDALSLLCYECGRGGGVLTENDVIGTLELFTRRVVGDREAATEAERWLRQLREDHLLVPTGPNKYVFVHATVMEFLAARFIAEKIKDSGYLDWVFKVKDFPAHLAGRSATFFESEVLPIAAGSGVETGTTLLAIIRRNAEEATMGRIRERFLLLGVRALVELEGYIDRQFRRKRAIYLHQNMKRVIQASQSTMDWVYRGLGELFTLDEPKTLQKALKTFHNISRLSRPDFLDRYLDGENFFSGTIELTTLRKKLLYRLANRERVYSWLESYKKKKESRPLDLPTFDSEKYAPEDKNFGYYRDYTRGIVTGFLGSSNLKHSGVVYGTAAGLGGRYFLSGSGDGTLKLWAAESGKEIRTFKGHKDYVRSVRFSPDGSRFLSGSDDQTIKMWDVESGKEIRTFSGHSGIVWSVCFNPEGSHFISGSEDQTIKMWDVESGKEIRTFSGQNGIVWSVCFSPDGSRFIAGLEKQTVKLWESESGKEIRTFKGHSGRVWSVYFCPDGSRFISGSEDQTIKMWDVESGKEIRTFSGHNGIVWSVCFCPDDSRIISGSEDQTVKLWESESGKEIRRFKGHRGKIWSVCFSPDGPRVITGSEDQTIKLWDTDLGKEIRTFKGHSGLVWSVCFSPDGLRFISGSEDHSIKLWEVESGKEIRTFKGHSGRIWSVCFSPDGFRIISGSEDYTIKLWESKSGKEIRTFRGHEGWVRSVCFGPGGTRFISGSSDRTVKCWDAESGKEIRTFKGHKGGVLSVCFAPGGTRFISGSSDRTVKCWDAESGKEIRTYEGHTKAVSTVLFPRDFPYIVSGSNDQTLKLWNPDNGVCIETIPLPWIPLELTQHPENPSFFACGNANHTVTFFDFSRFVGKK